MLNIVLMNLRNMPLLVLRRTATLRLNEKVQHMHIQFYIAKALRDFQIVITCTLRDFHIPVLKPVNRL